MLNRGSRIPLYQQLKEKLRHYIEQNLEPGDMLPTEPEIEKQYRVSRMTVRKALDELVLEGLVNRQQGRGTFVQGPKITHNIERITSWTEEMKLLGYTSKTKGLKIYTVKPSKKMQYDLRLDEGEKMICIKRIRIADGEPIAVMVNYLRERFVPGFLEKGLTHESLYETLENDYNIVLEDANEVIESREASELEAHDLDIPLWSPILHITRVSYLPNDVPFEMVKLSARGDRYQYRIRLSGRQKRRIVDIREDD